MTSVVDICNMALSEVGNRAQMITSLTESSDEANQCNLWYDTLRRRLLRTAPWGFCRYQTVLAQIGDLIPDQTSPFPWLWKYAHPSDCIKMRYVVTPPFAYNVAGAITPPQTGFASPPVGWLAADRSCRYVIASDVDALGNRQNVILTNVAQAIGVYNGDVTDPDLFDDLFIGALASSLAYKLCMPLTGNIGERNQFAQSAEAAILQARVADGNESVPRSDVVVDWMVTRGVGSAFGIGSSGPGPYAGWGSWNCVWDNMNWSS